MPLLDEGIYIANTDEQPYEWETNYYLDFQIYSAIKSIDKIYNCPKDSSDNTKTRARYYHYYLDHLLFSIRQISFRFIYNDKNPEKNERIEQNRKNYLFTDESFPTLSSKQATNTIEHIDEHNSNIILQSKGVGGFNYIDSDSDEELMKALLDRRHQHPYILDLLNHKIYIQRKGKEITIDIDMLKNELEELQKNVDSFSEFLSV